MKSARSAAFLHSAAAALERVARRLEPRRRSMADEVDSLRRELEAEAAAEFGLRNIPEDAYRRWKAGDRQIPDPASPGDVWPPTAYSRKLKAVK